MLYVYGKKLGLWPKNVANGTKLEIFKNVANSMKPVVKRFFCIRYKEIGEWPQNIAYGVKPDGWTKYSTYGIKLYEWPKMLHMV